MKRQKLVLTILFCGLLLLGFAFFAQENEVLAACYPEECETDDDCGCGYCCNADQCCIPCTTNPCPTPTPIPEPGEKPTPTPVPGGPTAPPATPTPTPGEEPTPTPNPNCAQDPGCVYHGECPGGSASECASSTSTVTCENGSCKYCGNLKPCRNPECPSYWIPGGWNCGEAMNLNRCSWNAMRAVTTLPHPVL